MADRPMKPDPLHDGSVGSYVVRFVICFVLGVFADLFILAGMVVFTVRGAEIVFELWFVWLLVPVIFGVGGVFAFDAILALYDRMHDDYTRDRW